MNVADHFEEKETCAVFRPPGRARLAGAIKTITEAIELARERKLRGLMVVAMEWAEFPAPRFFERYEMIHQWAAASRGFVRLALVTRPEMIDAQRFGVTVA